MIRLYGYPDNVWTDTAIEILRAAGVVDFELKSAPAGVNWDNLDHKFRRMPTLTLVSTRRECLLASGIEEIRELTERVENSSDTDLRAFLLSSGYREEDVDALWDGSDLGDHQEEQSET